MKNIPKIIYLQTGVECENFDNLQTDMITWSSDSIFQSDLRYISADFIATKIEELKKDRNSLLKNTMAPNKEINKINKSLTVRINILRELLED